MLGPIKTDYAWSGPSGVSGAPVPVHSGASGGQFEETRASKEGSQRFHNHK